MTYKRFGIFDTHDTYDFPWILITTSEVCSMNASFLSANCILQVWNYGPAFQPCKCPLCRRQITLLIPSEASSRQRHNSEVSEILQRVETYNRQFGERSNGLIQVSVCLCVQDISHAFSLQT